MSRTANSTAAGWSLRVGLQMVCVAAALTLMTNGSAGAPSHTVDPLDAIVRSAATTDVSSFAGATTRLLARVKLGQARQREIDRAIDLIPAFVERRRAVAVRRHAHVWPFAEAALRLVSLVDHADTLPAQQRAALHDVLLRPGERPSDHLVAWAGAPTGRGGTLNQRLLWAASGYVIGAFFDDAEEMAFHRDWLERMHARYVAELTWESDSAVYENVYLQAWWLLLKAADDPGIQAMARDVLDRMMVSFAAKYVDGLFCGISTRDKIPVSTPAFQPLVHRYLGPLFDGPDLPDPAASHAAVRLALVEYAPPPLALALARTDHVVEAQEHFAGYPYAPRTTGLPPHERNRWTFKRRHHVLGTMAYPVEEVAQAILPFHRNNNALHWKLCWNESGRFGHLFVTHPETRIPSLPERPDLWASPAEWPLQHRNVLASLFVIPENEPPEIAGLVPFGDADQMARDDAWLALRFGRLLVGLYVHNGITLQAKGFTYYDRPFDGVRSAGARNALVAVVYDVDDLAPGGPPDIAFARLRSLLRDQIAVDFDAMATPARLVVTAPALAANGKALEPATLDLAFRAHRRIDGHDVTWLERGAHYHVVPTAPGAAPWAVHYDGATATFLGTPPTDLRDR